MKRNWGKKVADARKAEAARLTSLMECGRSFSYVRIGDGELAWLIRIQRGEHPEIFEYSEDAGLKSYFTTGGRTLPVKYYDQLLEVFENCDYIDKFELAGEALQNGVSFADLKWQRSTELQCNPTPETSQIFYDWVLYEMKAYLETHRCLFIGSEAPLLKQLIKSGDYLHRAENYFPKNFSGKFAGVYEDGKEYWKHLTTIENDIVEKIAAFKADTVFISLSAGAKLLGHKISKELNVVTFDFGSMLRALANSATPGFTSTRASHTPFLLHLPLETYVAALMEERPGIEPLVLLRKAHAQLMQSLAKRDVGESLSVPDLDRKTLDRGKQDRKTFFEDYFWYKKVLLKSFAHTKEIQSEIDDFNAWRRRRWIGIDGYLFSALRTASHVLRGS